MNSKSSTFRFLKSFLKFAVVALLLVNTSWALDPFTIDDIRVEGLQRVEPGTVFATVPFRVGDTYTDEKGTQAIRGLFGLGLFKDLRIDIKGGVVVIAVEERPIIANLDFVGAKEFDKDALRKALREVGLAEGRPFDKSLADKAEQELKRQYINKSLYGAEVVTTITPIERNRVNLTFSVTEGDVAKIKEMRIVGAHTFSESTLLSQFDLSTPTWLSWYTKSDRYSQTKLNADIEVLKSYYQSRGFLEFKVNSTQVAISPNKQKITVTLNITEGERFVVAGVKLEGYFLGRDEEFKSLISIKPGEPYNINLVTQTTKAFTDFYGNFGFAFAHVEPRPEIDRATNRVVIVLQGDPSRRVYVRKINITGNAKTRDEIVRREFRQMESAWYDGYRIKISKDRLKRLGFFKEVEVDTKEIPGVPDQVDLQVTLTEKPTGSLQLGAGYSSAEKVFLTFGIQQDNVFGTGNYVGTQVSTSKYNQIFQINTTDPYVTDDGVSRSLNYYHRSSIPYVDQGGNYRLVTDGVGIRYGVPFAELDTVFLGVAAEQTQIKPGSNIPASYLEFAERFGYTTVSVPMTIGWARDSRDSLTTPNSGRFVRLNSEIGEFGDTRYTRSGAQFQQYIPITKQYTFAFNTEIDEGQGLQGRPYPVFKNYSSGGLGSVRGFTAGTLGPRDVTGLTVGGPKKFTLNTELLAPFPGAGNDKSLRLYAFFDMGNVYGETEKMDLSLLRSSVGVGLSWVSPMGPLRFAIANPERYFPGDRMQKVQFQIGTSF
jgi:outer membrane protein insertion porin family